MVSQAQTEISETEELDESWRFGALAEYLASTEGHE